MRFLGRVTITAVTASSTLTGRIEITQFAASGDPTRAAVTIDFTLSRTTPGETRSTAMRVRGLGPADIDGLIEGGDFSSSLGGAFRAASGSYTNLGAFVTNQ